MPTSNLETTPEKTEPQKKEGNATTFTCKGCGSAVSFTPGTEHLTCPYCKNNCDISAIEGEIEELGFHENLERAAEETDLEEHITVTCDGCGARTDLQPNVTAGHCPFCDSPLVAQHISEKRFSPRSLLPFNIPLKDAKTCFKTWISKRWFAPSSFYKEVRPDKLNGVYCPFWTYDAATHTSYKGQRGEYYYVTRTETVTVNGKQQTRTRRERKIRWHRASGNVNNNFDDLLVRASRGLPAKLAKKLEPWDLHKLRPYQSEFLSGFKVESYTIGLEEGFSDAKEQMVPDIKRTIRHDIGGDEQRIHSTRINYSKVTFKHILLPVWISAYLFKGKTYRFLINANTGEVQGERPYSVIKIALLCVTIAAIIALAFFLFQ